MDVKAAARFISSLTKSLQSVLHGSLDFEKDIELGGYIYLRVDNSEKVDYVLSEKMQKNDVNSLTFLSNSFHAFPHTASDKSKSSRSGSADHAREQANRAGHSPSQSSSQSQQPRQCHPSSSGHQEPRANHSAQHSYSTSPHRLSTSSETKQSLTDFKTAFHSSRSPVLQPALQNFPFHQTGRGDAGSSGGGFPATGQHQQLNRVKGGALSDGDDLEMVFIKTENEDEVFSIPLNQPAGSVADDLSVGRKAPLLPMGTRPPLLFPYSRLAYSQSWDRSPAHGFFSRRTSASLEDAPSGSETFSCKVCGKTYRSRQGVIFHERVKHQKVYNVYCPVCGKGFQQTTHMYGHMATHTNVKNFQCPKCGAKYAHKTSLQQHLRSGSCKMFNPLSPMLPSTQLSGGRCGDERTSPNSRPSGLMNPENSVLDMSMDHSDRLRSQSQYSSVTSESSNNVDADAAFSPQNERSAVDGREEGEITGQDFEQERSPTPDHTCTSLPDFKTADSTLSVSADNILPSYPLPVGSQQQHAQQDSWMNTHSQQQSDIPVFFNQPQVPTDPGLGSAPLQNIGHATTSQPLASASFSGRFSRIACGLCGHVSISTRGHARHMTVRHSMRGNFTCEHCGKVFQTRLYLSQHMKSHGERKFVCKLCNKRFIYKHHLPRHQRSVHGIFTSDDAEQSSACSPESDAQHAIKQEVME